jgi:tRNA threonylcarbamoyladenosine biosynthesis protein TsaB
MRFLGIDTAIPTASVALIENGGVVVEANQGELGGQSDIRTGGQAIGNHAEIIIPLIQSLLDKAQITVKDLSGISLSIGPGSFTGLRIGLATAKGLVYDTGLPLVGISTLEANAARVNDFDGMIGVLLDARKGEIYIALFRRSAAALARLTADSVLPIQSAIKLLQSSRDDRFAPLLLIGDGAQSYERQLRAALGHSVAISNGARYTSVAAQVAMLAIPRLAAASGDDIGMLTPVYLRLSEAETKRQILPQLVEFTQGSKN